jgi:hypothetical protein
MILGATGLSGTRATDETVAELVEDVGEHAR